MRRTSSNTAQRGFTLLEVLVALGIAATSLVSLYTLAGQLLKGAAALETRQSALWCADNQLVTVFLSQYAPPIAQTQHPCTQLRRSYAVVQVISPTPNPLFRRIELSVYAATAGETVSAESKAERLAFLATVIPQDAGAP